MRTGLHRYDNNISAGTFGTGPHEWISFMDWNRAVNVTPAWGDDLHSIAPGVITHTHYFYLNSAGSATQVIKMHAQVTPSASHLTGTISIGVTTTSFAVGPLPPGIFLATIGVPATVVPRAMGVSFNDPAGPGAFRTFWACGGVPGIGFSHNGLNYQTAGGAFNYGVPGTFGPFYTTFGGVFSLMGNIVVAFGVPEPTTSGAPALARLPVLRRRRA